MSVATTARRIDPIKQALEHIRTGRSLAGNPLLALDVVDRTARLRGMSRDATGRSAALAWVIEAIIVTRLAACAATDSRALPDRHAGTWDEQALIADFSAGDIEREVWSAVFHRYLSRVPRGMRVDQLARLTQADVASGARLINRRIGRGMQLLSDALRVLDENEMLPLPMAQAPNRPRRGAVHNLPFRRTSFVDREADTRWIQEQLLAGTALVTVVGPPGIGKTRLAMQAAPALVPHFPDGIWYVDLAAIVDGSFLAHTIAVMLGIPDRPGVPMAAGLTDALKTSRLLLVMDNCEHLLDACGNFTAALLRDCAEVQILATSRERLAVEGEVLWALGGLSSPEATGSGTPGRAMQYPAVKLFVERAAAASGAFKMDAETVLAVTDLCHRLDGMPLAIELAASRVPALGAGQLAGQLHQALRAEKLGPQRADPRYHALRESIDWSYRLLGEPERSLLRRLAVFRSGWTLSAATKVCDFGHEGERAVIDRLAMLIDGSLVMLTDGSEPRYRLLEPIRQFAMGRLEAAGEAAEATHKHLEWCVTLAEEAADGLLGREQSHWLARLVAEHGNLIAALDRARDDRTNRDLVDADWTDRAEMALRLAIALRGFWELRGTYTEGRKRIDGALAAFPAAAPVLRARALTASGHLAAYHGDFPHACRALEEALDYQRAAGDQRGVAEALDPLVVARSMSGQHDLANTASIEGLAIGRGLGDKRLVRNFLAALSHTAVILGEFTAGQPYAREYLTLSRELGDAQMIARGSIELAMCLSHVGDFAQARALIEEGIAIAQRINDVFDTFFGLWFLTLNALATGDLAAAQSTLPECAHLMHVTHSAYGTPYCLEAAAYLAAAEGRFERAGRLLGAAEAVREATSAPLPSASLPWHVKATEAIRDALGEDGFQISRIEGRGLTAEVALGMVIDDDGSQ